MLDTDESLSWPQFFLGSHLRLLESNEQDDDKFHSSAKTKVTGCDSAADLTSLNVAYFVKMLLRC